MTGYGIGTHYSDNMHSRWYARSLSDRMPRPPDGKVAGGPNSGIQDPVAQANLQGCAPQLCYIDDIESWSTNETTSNWNAALAWYASFLADMGHAAPYASEVAIDRISGPGRIETAVQVAQDGFADGAEEVVLARADVYALAGAPVATRRGAPVLLSESDRLSEATAEAAVSPAVYNQLADGRDARRIAGATRYENAAAVHAEAGDAGADPGQLWLATGENWPDALTAGPAVGLRGSTFALVPGDDLADAPATEDLLERHREAFRRIVLVGGTDPISAEVEEQIRALLAPHVP